MKGRMRTGADGSMTCLRKPGKFPGPAVPASTKTAVALECAGLRDGVRVNSIHPGIIDTPIWNAIPGAAGSNAPRDLDAMAAMGVPLGVKGVPMDIAEGVLWLASEESRYVTGAELVIDGGLTVR